jgi:hypothetical protein
VAFTLDVTTDRGRVRVLIGDTDTVNATAQVLDDATIDMLLGLAEQGVLRAAAFGCEAIAANEVLVQKRIRTLDLSTDGPAEAAALRELAKSYREQAEVGDSGALPFEIAEMVPNQFAARERVWDQALREES